MEISMADMNTVVQHCTGSVNHSLVVMTVTRYWKQYQRKYQYLIFCYHQEQTGLNIEGKTFRLILTRHIHLLGLLRVL